MECWRKAEEIKAYFGKENERGTTDEITQLWANFHNSAFRLAKEKGVNQNTLKDGSLTAIIWQNHLTENNITKHFSKDQFIVQLWKETNVCNNTITIMR